MRSKVHQTFIWLSVIMVTVTVGSMIYFNSLYNLLDTTEITGDPTIAESDLADPEERLPLASVEQTADITEPSLTETAPQLTSAQPVNPTSSQTASQTTETADRETTGTTGSQVTTASESTSLPETSPPPTTSETPEPTLSIQSLYPIKFSNDVYNILLIGSDTRGEGFSGRSDAIMILSVNRRTSKIHLISLIRGLYVAIEGHDRSMLNNAYSWGGAKLLMQTVQENFRIQIDDYVVINFSGFRQAIDIVGGVEIKLTQAEVDYLLLAFPAAYGIFLATQVPKSTQYSIFFGIFLAFLLMEWLLDHVFKINFRENWHKNWKWLVPYLILFYAMNYGFVVMPWKHSLTWGLVMMVLFVVQIVANMWSHPRMNIGR